jgi:hypothetical protein
MGVQQVLQTPLGLYLHQGDLEMLGRNYPPVFPFQALWELESYEAFSSGASTISIRARAPASALELPKKSE